MQIEGAFEEKDFRAKVTREEFEELCADLLNRVPGPVDQALKSSAIPLVRENCNNKDVVWKNGPFYFQ